MVDGTPLECAPGATMHRALRRSSGWCERSEVWSSDRGLPSRASGGTYPNQAAVSEAAIWMIAQPRRHAGAPARSQREARTARALAHGVHSGVRPVVRQRRPRSHRSAAAPPTAPPALALHHRLHHSNLRVASGALAPPTCVGFTDHRRRHDPSFHQHRVRTAEILATARSTTDQCIRRGEPRPLGRATHRRHPPHTRGTVGPLDNTDHTAGHSRPPPQHPVSAGRPADADHCTTEPRNDRHRLATSAGGESSPHRHPRPARPPAEPAHSATHTERSTTHPPPPTKARSDPIRKADTSGGPAGTSRVRTHSHATTPRDRSAVPVATVDELPTSRVCRVGYSWHRRSGVARSRTSTPPQRTRACAGACAPECVALDAPTAPPVSRSHDVPRSLPHMTDNTEHPHEGHTT